MRKAIFLLLSLIAVGIAAVLLIAYGLAEGSRKSLLIGRVGDLREFYQDWKEHSRPRGEALQVSYSRYKASRQHHPPVSPVVFVAELSLPGRKSECIFSLTDKDCCPDGRLVVTTNGECFLLSDSGQARILADFEAQIRPLLNRKVGNYTLNSQQVEAPNERR